VCLDFGRRISVILNRCIQAKSGLIEHLFAILIVFCQVVDPNRLWQNHRASMAEDILFRKQQECPSDDINKFRLKLKTNMRILSSDQENKTFALLLVGNGQSLIINGKIIYLSFVY